MGNRDIATGDDEQRRHAFAQALLEDLDALSQMVRSGMMERGVRRIGFEQEMFLVRKSGRPAPIAMEMLAALEGASFTTEIGRYNLECNSAPSTLEAGCLTALEQQLDTALARARAAAQTMDADVLLAGILPSIQLADLVLANLTPLPRYRELDRLITSLCGGEVRTHIQGRDTLQLSLPNVMLETCNTSIQVHLQVDLDQMSRIYNIAQQVSGPVVAAAANSPLLLQRRLWHETRIPTFEQSVDIRSTPIRQRDTWQRVHFGDDWVSDNILDVYRDQIARHRITLMGETGESSLELLARGDVPPLRALALHNGSLYRWNRLCYGISNGQPHLRIEHRPLASGPTVIDEVANTALFLGLVFGLEADARDVRTQFDFSDAKANFIAGATSGLDATMYWNGKATPARTLLSDTLLPLAEDGLKRVGIGDAECARYLGVIAGRIANGVNGARWTLDAYDAFDTIPKRIARAEAVTRAIMTRQWDGKPVHEWSAPTAAEIDDWTSYCSTVSDLMTTDVFTVRPNDLVDVAASVIEWKNVRHVPVEDDNGVLVGLLSHRKLLEYWAQNGRDSAPVAVRDVMQSSPPTVHPLDTAAHALALMRKLDIACLPVVLDGRLIGIVSEYDFLPLAERWLSSH